MPYWDWLRELTRLKLAETEESVRRWCQIAAAENRAAGVGLIVEHSDRPFAVEALVKAGIRSMVLQELITFDEAPDVDPKWAMVVEKRATQRADAITPHATWSVDRDSLSRFSQQEFVSIHVAESRHEPDLFESHSGPIAEFFVRRGKPFPRRQPILDLLSEVGLLRQGVQLVHIGALAETEYERLAEAGVMIAHCPRSNINLGCPVPNVRRLLDLKIRVGLGMDSAASSGPIDMFAEIRTMMRASDVTASEAWRISCDADAVAMSSDGVSWNLWNSPATNDLDFIEMGAQLEVQS